MSKIRDFSNLIAIHHSVFALPYSLCALLIAHRNNASIIVPHSFYYYFFLILLSLLAARSAAMAFNRIVDASIDAKNPRTFNREIPQGKIRITSASYFCLVSILIFLCSAYFLGWHCFILSPLVLFFLLFYSYTKRFTSASHFFLGLALALAPGGAWWVLRPQVELIPLVLMAAVLFWVTGFDILYSCQDYNFDKQEKMFSIPVKLGIKNALKLAFFLHIVTLVLFLLVGYFAELNYIYFLGMLVIGGLLIGQHFIISESDLSRINKAFFTANGCVSILYLVFVYFSL